MTHRRRPTKQTGKSVRQKKQQKHISQDTKIYTIQDTFSTTITPASMGHLPTRSKRQRKQAGGSRTLRFTLTKQDKFSIPAQERKPRQMKFYLTSNTRTQPHPLRQPTTSKFTAQRKRNDKPPYTVYFQLLLLHLQKTNKETTSHPRPIKPPTYDKSCYTRSKLRINRQNALGFNKLRTNRQSALGFYGWIPHKAGFGFLDIARPTLGQIHF